MDDSQIKQFICPMQCEGTKVYDQPGDCPVCSMHLVPVDGNNKHHEHHHEEIQPEHNHGTHMSQKEKYFCPMKCEGDKTYDKPGNCPVCNMHLIPVGSDKKHTGHHHAGMETKKSDETQTQKKDQYYCTMLCEGNKTYPEPGELSGLWHAFEKNRC